MESLASPINTDEGGLTLSDDTGGKSCEEYNILLDKLEKKTDEFMKIIGTTKTVQVYPLDDIAYKKLEAFITSADNIIKWYELNKSRSKTTIDKLLNEV
uniref:Uncharacterized protein n=1 Tax=Panagrolaimus davidi TaxID=227884 RepID=A0A914QME8_9BILA